MPQYRNTQPSSHRRESLSKSARHRFRLSRVPSSGTTCESFLVPLDAANSWFSEYSHPVLPDSCIDIVFINDELPIVVGPWTDPFITKFFAGARITGARLRPGYAPSVLGVPASELLNRSIPLTVLWGRRGTEPFARVGKSRLLLRADLLSRRFSRAVSLLPLQPTKP